MGKHSHTNSGMGGFMSGGSIRFSKYKGGGSGGADAWRDQLTFNKIGGSGGSSGRQRTTGTKLPKVYSIHSGTIVSVQPFGAFVQLGKGDTYKDGLVHVSAIFGSERLESPEEAGLDVGMKVWVKVSDLKEEEMKYSLDMRFVNQKDGTDLDPYQAKGKVPDNFFEGKGRAARRQAAAPATAAATTAVDPKAAVPLAAQEQLKRKAPDSSASGSASESSDDVSSEERAKIAKKLKRARKKLEKAKKKAEKAKKKKDKVTKAKIKTGKKEKSSEKSSSPSGTDT